MDKRYWSARAQRLVPYVPGEIPGERKVIKLNTNENPYPPAPEVLKAIERTVNSELRMYPDPDCVELRRAIAGQHGLSQDQVFCGNGSDEVLALSFYAFFTPGKAVKFPDITYTFYSVYTDLFELEREEIPLNEDFSFPVEQFLSAPGGAVICNPNAPTGQILSRSDLRRILESNPGSVILVDEAYADFGTESVVPLLGEYPNLIVVHTMSKSNSLAGMRVGYALGAPDLIAAVNCVKNSFNSYPLDRLAQAAGIAAMQNQAYYQGITNKIIETRTWVTQVLRELGFLVHDSNTNFLFAAHPDYPGREIQRSLRDRGILVRRFDRPRISDYLRITIGTPEEMKTTCAALREIVKG